MEWEDIRITNYFSGSLNKQLNMIFPILFHKLPFFPTFGFIPCLFFSASQCNFSCYSLNSFLQEYEVVQSASCNNISD